MNFSKAHIQEGECVLCGVKTDLTQDLYASEDKKDVMRVPVCQEHKDQVTVMTSKMSALFGDLPTPEPDRFGLNELRKITNNGILKALMSGNTDAAAMAAVLDKRMTKMEEMLGLLTKSMADSLIKDMVEILTEKMEDDDDDKGNSEGQAESDS